MHTVNSPQSFSRFRLLTWNCLSCIIYRVTETVSLGHCLSDTWITRNCPGRNCEVPDEQSKQHWRYMYAFGAFCSHALSRIFTLNGKEWHLWQPNNFTSTADLYNIEIAVVSTLRHDATMVISPSSSIPTARVQLGHMCGWKSVPGGGGRRRGERWGGKKRRGGRWWHWSVIYLGG